MITSTGGATPDHESPPSGLRGESPRTRAAGAAPAAEGRRRGHTGGAATRRRIIDAALETLRNEGYASTTARAIASRGGFNPALIFYHFGSVDDLLLAALDHTSARRMARYRSALADADGVAATLAVVRRLYEEDTASPHITAVQEMVASASFSATLGPAIARRLEPWLDLAEEVVSACLRGNVMLESVPARDVAFGLVAFYLGLETVSRLMGERSRLASLFDAGVRMGPALDLLGGGRAGPAQRVAPRPIPVR